MIGIERKKYIIEMIRVEKSLQISNLCEKFNVSVATIRRDLKELEDQKLLRCVYGGAVLEEDPTLLDYSPRINCNQFEKKAIGKAAAKLVVPGSTLVLDVGTTVMAAAKEMSNIPDLTVVTTSIPIMFELSKYKNMQVLCPGGKLNRMDVSLFGSVSESGMNDFFVDIAFIGASAVSLENGVTNFICDSAKLCACEIKHAKKTVLLVDSSKFAKTRFTKICDISAVTTIITDNGIPRDYKKAISDLGVELIIVNPKEYYSTEI